MPIAPRRGPGRPRKMPAEEQRASVLAAGREVFARAGFGAATVEEIARKAGVGRHAVYEQLGDKNALFDAVVEATTREAMAAFGRPADASPGGGSSSGGSSSGGSRAGGEERAAARRGVARCCAYCMAHPDAVALLREAARTGHPRFARVRARLATGFSSAIGASAPRDHGRSAELLTTLLFAMSDALHTMSWAGAAPEDDAVFELFAEFASGGIAQLLTVAPDVLARLD